MKLRDIETAIRQATGSEAIYSMLSQLLEAAEASVGDPSFGFDADRMSQVARYLAEIRYLLDQLGSDPVAARESWTARDFAERYRDLEGKVNERRNYYAGIAE